MPAARLKLTKSFESHLKQEPDSATLRINGHAHKAERLTQIDFFVNFNAEK